MLTSENATRLNLNSEHLSKNSLFDLSSTRSHKVRQLPSETRSFFGPPVNQDDYEDVQANNIRIKVHGELEVGT